MEVGFIKHIVEDRGYGFIAHEGGRDLFFHCRSLPADLPWGEVLTGRRVQFTIEDSPRGQRAVGIRGAV